jgi:hypothetical protein
LGSSGVLKVAFEGFPTLPSTVTESDALPGAAAAAQRSAAAVPVG